MNLVRTTTASRANRGQKRNISIAQPAIQSSVFGRRAIEGHQRATETRESKNPLALSSPTCLRGNQGHITDHDRWVLLTDENDLCVCLGAAGAAGSIQARQKTLSKSPANTQDLKSRVCINRSMFVTRHYGTVLIYLFCLVVFSGCLRAQSLVPLNASRNATAVRTERAPRIDGTLDDPVWQTAPAIGDFRQREPLETKPATEKTEVHILYDSRHIYIGVHCYDRDPKRIVATQLRQDLSQDLDDNFAVVIDPTLSRRNGYIFQVNPLGTERDGEVIEEQGPPGSDSIVDPSWDG